MGKFVLVERVNFFLYKVIFYDYFKKYFVFFYVINFNLLELIIGLLFFWFSKEVNYFFIF